MFGTQISIVHVILVIIAIKCLISMYEFFSPEKKGDKEDSGKKRETKKQRKDDAPSMATRSEVAPLSPVFAEKTDWSIYEQPAYTRNKKSRKSSAKAKPAPTAEKAAQSNTVAEERPARSNTPRTKGTPQQQMQAFKENVRNRRQDETPRYESV